MAVARSLGPRGVRFVTLGHEPRGVIAHSRYVKRYLFGPVPEREPEAFAERVLDIVSKHGVRLVIPMNDAALSVCDRYREGFPPGTVLAAAPSPAVRNVLDKRGNLELARRLGIPCPSGFEPRRVEELPELIDQLGFPIVLKHPGYSADGTRSAFDFKWLVARDRQELTGYLERYCSSGQFPLFQEHVGGTVRNLCCFGVSGEMVAVHEYRGIRRIDGASVFREVTDTTPALARYAERLLRELRWDGVAHIGFFVGDGGDVMYMETNGRFWASLEGSTRIGWDFPYWAYRYFTGGELPQPPPLAVGSRMCWHYGDLRLLARHLRDGALDDGPPSRGKAIADYVSAFRPSVHSEELRLDDPLPALVEHAQGVRQALAARWSRAE